MKPTLAQMRMALAKRNNPVEMRSVGVNEAPDMATKAYMPPAFTGSRMPPPGGVAIPNGMPIGGIDTNRMQPGQQLMPQPPVQPGQAPVTNEQPGRAAAGLPQGNAPGAQPNPMPTGFGPTPAPAGPPSNILNMTQQGRAMSAMAPVKTMAKGGSITQSGVTFESPKETRMIFQAKGPGGIKGINVPRHMWEGSKFLPGMKEVNKARAAVYGSENRDPLTIGQMGKKHRETLEEHFKKPVAEQMAAEKEALNRLREAKHIGKTANTLDKSEKLDTVRHEYDEQGRPHEGYASKGVAGHALYTSGHGENETHHVLNTCPGQTAGCGGGKDEKGIVDTSKGTCFAPVAESQYPAAAVRRASHAQAKHEIGRAHV